MKKLLIVATLAFLLGASPCFGAAENIYVSQAGSGSDFQTNCATGSRSIAWLNDAANWGGGANEVDAGDTVHLCGTLTSPLTIQGSGSSGSVITILFETDAKFSAATWTTLQGVISATGKDYIVIDGGTNGHIEATNNGTTKTYQNMPRGIEINACDNWEIKNLSIHDLYVYTSGSDTMDDGGMGIFIDGTSGNSDNLSIHDNSFTWASAAIQQYVRTGGHDISVYNNTIRYCNAGIIFGSTGAASTWTNASFYNNEFSDPNVWDDPVMTCANPPANSCTGWGTGTTLCNCFHHEFFHYWNVNSTANAVTGVKVYGNYTHGNFGTYNTAGIFFENYVTTPLIYNNLMVGDGYRKIYLKAAGPAYIVANNTMQGWGYSLDCIDGTTVTYKNNISWETAGRQNGGSITASNNNEDAVDPLLDTSFKPTALSTMLIGQGAQLNTSFTTDKDGAVRGDTWDIGAYEYGGEVLPQYTLTLTVVGTGTVTGAITGAYDTGTVLNMTATSGTGYWFAGWSGNCTSTGALTSTVTMVAAKSCTATFRANTVTIGTGAGTATIGSGAGTMTIAP